MANINSARAEGKKEETARERDKERGRKKGGTDERKGGRKRRGREIKV